MDISARSFFSTGMSLTAAAAIAFAPLPIPVSHPTVTIPAVTVPDVSLAGASDDIAAAIAGLQMFFDDASVTAAGIAGLPGRSLIGVAGGIETFFDVALTKLIDATADPTAAASLTILRTLAVDAWAKLEENLGLINPAITGATEQVGKLLTGAVTGSLQNVLIAVTNVITNPLALQNYVGLVTAGLASGQLVVGNGLRAIQEVGDAGFDIAGIAVRELTFQFTNLIGGASALLTQLGDASGMTIVNAVLGAVRDFVLAPARAVINFNSGLIQAGLTAANAGFDVVLGGATDIVDPPVEEPAAVAAKAPHVEVTTIVTGSEAEDVVDEVLDTPTDGATTSESPAEEVFTEASTAAAEPVEEEDLGSREPVEEEPADDELSVDDPAGDDLSDGEASPGDAPAADAPSASGAPTKSAAPSDSDAPTKSDASSKSDTKADNASAAA